MHHLCVMSHLCGLIQSEPSMGGYVLVLDGIKYKVYRGIISAVVIDSYQLMRQLQAYSVTGCNWLLGFLTGRKQTAKVCSNTSSTITSTGTLEGCGLGPLLFTLLTHVCTPPLNFNLFIKFADDATVVGHISHNDKNLLQVRG